MRVTLKRSYVMYVLIAAFLAGMVLFVADLAINGSAWAANRVNRHIYSNGQTINSGTVFDRNGVALVSSVDGKRVFADSKTLRMATLHVVGDTGGYISTGTQSLYRDKLTGYSFVGGIYKLIEDGKGSDLTLNIDSEACRVAYEALGSHNGTVAVYNYKTGALLCSVSKPTYDVNNKPVDLLTNKKYDGVFLDKLISGVYTPGSIMKIVTAACAIENIPDIEQQTFECDGECELRDGTVICNGVHGEVTFEEAFNQSCNCAFAEIAVLLGPEKLLATANAMGFNTQLFANGIRLATSAFSPSATSESELGWAGIGQSTTLVNPCHILMIAGAIANGGEGVAPQRIKSDSIIVDTLAAKAGKGITLNSATAKRLSELMRSNVVNKYGDDEFPDLEMCAKTGTAQLDGDRASHSWLTGFSARADFPLAVVCIVENGGYGSGIATDVSNEVLQYFLEHYTFGA